MLPRVLRRRGLRGLVVLAGAAGPLLLAADQVETAAKAAKGPARWEDTIRKFETTDATKPPPKGAVLLVGGSNARRWAHVSDYFPGRSVINRGFGGAHLADVLHFFDRIVLPYAPRVILLNAGGNDLSSGRTPEEIRDTARDFIARVHAALPDTRVYHLSLPPVLRAAKSPESMAMIRRLNGLMADLARTEKNVEFVDLFTAFLDAGGQSRPELFVEDGTHFSAKGYEVVAGLLRGKF